MTYIMYSVESRKKREHPRESPATQAAQHRQQILGVGAPSFDLRAVTVFN